MTYKGKRITWKRYIELQQARVHVKEKTYYIPVPKEWLNWLKEGEWK